VGGYFGKSGCEKQNRLWPAKRFLVTHDFRQAPSCYSDDEAGLIRIETKGGMSQLTTDGLNMRRSGADVSFMEVRLIPNMNFRI
jgi:hypothetical protein